MADIVLADHGLVFDGAAVDERALGGAETAFCELAAALAARGHRVAAFAAGARRLRHSGVEWAPVEDGVPDTADLFVANRGNRVLALCPRAKRTVFWVHNPASYLLKLRYQWPLARRRPLLVFTGAYHAATYPPWGMGGPRHIIPLGVSAAFLGGSERPPPPPVALFTSNPLRGLEPLADLWSATIRPRVPGARLLVHAGPSLYGSGRLSAAIAEILKRVAARGGDGIEVRPPIAKAALAQAMTGCRLLLYSGSPDETFCLAVAEAQAMGLPAVVGRVGAMAERVRDGTTGFIADSGAAMAEAAVRLLTDDGLWQNQHRAALAASVGAGWDAVAAAFEALAA